MTINEKEAFQPFLHGDHDSNDSRDGSLELPELTRRDIGGGPSTDESRPSSSGHDSVNDKPHPQKKPATYAIIFMLGAQVFSASMNVSIRLLENTSTHLHPLQVRSPVAYRHGAIIQKRICR